MENKKKIPETLTLWDNIIFIKDSIKEGKARMQEIEQDSAEKTRDASIMARELFISNLSYRNKLSNFEKKISVFLLNGDAGEEALESKFEVLKQLLEIYRKVQIITQGENE